MLLYGIFRWHDECVLNSTKHLNITAPVRACYLVLCMPLLAAAEVTDINKTVFKICKMTATLEGG